MLEKTHRHRPEMQMLNAVGDLVETIEGKSAQERNLIPVEKPKACKCVLHRSHSLQISHISPTAVSVSRAEDGDEILKTTSAAMVSLDSLLTDIFPHDQEFHFRVGHHREVLIRLGQETLVLEECADGTLDRQCRFRLTPNVEPRFKTGSVSMLPSESCLHVGIADPERTM